MKRKIMNYKNYTNNVTRSTKIYITKVTQEQTKKNKIFFKTGKLTYQKG